MTDDLHTRLRALEAENRRLRQELAACEHGRSLRALSKREALLAVAERVAHLGSWSWDLATGEIEWSDEMYRMLGLEPGSVVPSSERFFAAIEPLDRARVTEDAQRAITSGNPTPCEFRMPRDGMVRKFRLESAVLTDEHGKRSHMVGTVLDLTDAERSAELLSRLVSELRSAERVARLASFTWTFEPPRVEWSPGMYLLLGLSGDETPSEELFRSHVHPDDLELLLTKRSETIATGIAESITFRVVPRGGGVLNVTLDSEELRDIDGRVRGFRGVLQDVTRRHALEEQVRQSQKMEAIGTLAGGVAHDFNNYLMVICGQAELLESALGASHPERASIAAIQHAAERCAVLTGQLLTLSRRRRAEPRPVDLAALVARLAPILHAALGEAIALSLRVDEPDAVILADSGHTEQVLMNLAFNARDAMPNGGTLTLSIERVVDEAARDAPGVSRASRIRLSVRDTGHGIAPEHRARIFEPFFTTKLPGHGTGLGLSTVYGLVQQSGGRIEFESELGRGTVFRVYWSAAVGVEELERSAPSAEASLPDTPCTVLLVEDVAEVRDTLQRQLERAGHRVLPAAHGAAALEIAARERGEIDVVVSDVIMPLMGGLELERRLLALYPELPCLLMTGYADGVVTEHAGRRQVLLKPYAIRDLLAALRALCVRRPRRAPGAEP